MKKQSGAVVKMIELEKLIPFDNHPFLVRDDEQLRMIVESVKEVGVLIPGIVRPMHNDTYEIIAGHRRKRACEVAGLPYTTGLYKS